MKKYKKGLFIGRFQPFHKGHLYMLQKATELFDSFIIGIGSVDKTDTNNPFSYSKRRQMIKKVIVKERFQNIEKIIGIEDDPDDTVWLKKTLLKVEKIDAVIGNNNWVNGIFKNAGYAIVKFPFYKREIYEGIQIRNLIKSGKKWDDRVPEYLKEIITKTVILKQDD